MLEKTSKVVLRLKTEPHGYDINAMKECMTDLKHLHADHSVPTRTVRCFPNNKPWILSILKKLMKKKKKKRLQEAQ